MTYKTGGHQLPLNAIALLDTFIEIFNQLKFKPVLSG